MIDKVKDVVDKDVKDSTQTAASENNEGSVNHVQGKNTEVTKLTERGLCIELDYKYTSTKFNSHPVFFSKLCFSSFFLRMKEVEPEMLFLVILFCGPESN